LYSRKSNSGLVYETQLLGPQYIEELDSDFTKEEIRESTLKMKNNKATGFDGIPAEMWKMFCTMKGGTEILVEMFDKVKKGKRFPEDWKISIICQIYKGRCKRGEPGNYRGISLLSVLCKMYSSILAGRLRNWLVNNKILSRFQAGFVKGKRSTDNIFVIKTTVNTYLIAKKGRIYWCLVDLESL
jgi:hypothetical protein